MRYLTLYRIDSDDPWAVMQQVKKDNERRKAAGELPEYFESYETTVWDFVAVRQSVQTPVRPATRLPDGMPEVILLVFSGADPAEADASTTTGGCTPTRTICSRLRA